MSEMVNGWSNRATWIAHLHLSADPELLALALESMHDAHSQVEIAPSAWHLDSEQGVDRIYRTLRRAEADALEYLVQAMAHDVLNSAEPSAAATMVRDSLGEWLYRVDWLEIVDALAEIQQDDLTAEQFRRAAAREIHAEAIALEQRR